MWDAMSVREGSLQSAVYNDRVSGAFRSEDESVAHRLAVLREEHARLSGALRARPKRTPFWAAILVAVLGVLVVVGPLAVACVSCQAAYKHAFTESSLQRKRFCEELFGGSRP
jgi:hypothetical protein